jgi:hypothetical protein
MTGLLSDAVLVAPVTTLVDPLASRATAHVAGLRTQVS